MLRSSSKKKQAVIDEAVKETNQDLTDAVLVTSLEENMAIINELFKDVDVFKTKYIKNANNDKLRFCIAYCCGVVDKAYIGENIIEPLSTSGALTDNADLITAIKEKVIQIPDVEPTNSLLTVVEAISYGDTVLFTDGVAEALVLGTQSFSVRSVSEPENERVLSGPREGFTESLMTNLSMLRRRVRTNKLKMKSYTFGKRTKTLCSVCYLDDVVNKKILQELYRRLDKIDIDGVLDTNYISELIKDAQLSPFRTTGYTERPDTVIARLLEGRIAILVDGSPSVLTLPFLFIENFQSSEDYYMNYYYTTFSRMLRMFGFFLTIIVPGLYIAIVAYHHEMLPTQLLLNITVERQGVPLPASIEAFLMLIVFDILRETGVRMPSNVGQALSIVGALVIGQSAVEAKMVAAPMIIIVALTGITNLLVPRLSGPVIFLRYAFLLAASLLGFYGLIITTSAATIHILNLRSFGIPQMMAAGNVRFQEVKDTFFRAPWWKMLLRPKGISKNKTRMKPDGEAS
jgi:spore germination protein KA